MARKKLVFDSSSLITSTNLTYTGVSPFPSDNFIRIRDSYLHCLIRFSAANPKSGLPKAFLFLAEVKFKLISVKLPFM